MKIGVLGAGQMGRGIAQVAIVAGYETKIFDISGEALAHAASFIEKQLTRQVSKERMSEEEKTKALHLLTTEQEKASLYSCDLIIEAVSEKMSLKKELFSYFDEHCPERTILASNTSSISITELAAVTKRPERVVGMHFMNPVPVMKLIEGIRGLDTSDETCQVITEVGEKMGKRLIWARDVAGFAVNRILMPMINEGIFALYEGLASKEDIDAGMKLGTNMPMGPLELADFIGLDTCLAIMEVVYEHFADSKYRPCPLLRQYVAAGKYGRKSGEGFYTY